MGVSEDSCEEVLSASGEAQFQGLGTRGGSCPLWVCAHSVVCVYVPRGLGKLFSRMFFEPWGPGKSQHGLQGLENFLSLGEPTFIEVGHPTGLEGEQGSVVIAVRGFITPTAACERPGNICILALRKQTAARLVWWARPRTTAQWVLNPGSAPGAPGAQLAWAGPGQALTGMNISAKHTEGIQRPSRTFPFSCKLT